jgi:hypothetical protein
MSVSSDIHYVDTNVVIECHRVGCWGAITSNLKLATVDQVIQECGTGGGNPNYVVVNVVSVREDVDSRSVTKKELVELRLQLCGRVSLDPGEEHLLARAIQDPTSWHICSPDNALVRGCWILNRLDRVISLEELLEVIGHIAKIPLKRQYTKSWLVGKRTDLLLEEL